MSRPDQASGYTGGPDGDCLEIGALLFPTVEAFAAAGFAFESLQPVPQVSAPGLQAAVERVRQRADSTLKPLPDEEFAQGLAALERAAAAEPTPTPVVDQLDLLVLR